MALEPLSLSKVAKSLETSSSYEFQVILKTLTSARYVDDKLLKSDLAVLVAKILKLLRSSDDYFVWKGCKLSDVLCAYNAVVLCSQAGPLLTALFGKLEPKAGFYRTTVSSLQGKTVLFSLVKSVDILLDLIRGKPALTREVLTPRLPAIIGVLINLSQFEPALCCPVLKKLLVKNTTTFRPHIGKYNNVLVTLIVKDYNHFDKRTKRLILENFALLNLIKQNTGVKDETMRHHKAFQDEQWRQGMMNVLYSFKPVINLCGEILDFSADEDMKTLMNKLPSSKSEEMKEFLPPVNVDLNKPSSLWAIAERLDLLCDLVVAFVTQHTPFRMRVPLGGVVVIAEAILSLTTNYLPLQRLLRRDAELTSTISAMLPTLQASGVSLLGSMSQMYGKSLLPYTPSVLASLEFFIPMKQGTTSIDFDKVDSLKDQFFGLFAIVDIFLSHTGHLFNETTLFTKLIDIALHMTRDAVPLKHLYQKQNATSKASSQKSKKAGKQNTGSMSDVYSHPHAFIGKCSLRKYDSLNCFLTRIVVNLKLQSAHQIKITNYAITTTLRVQKEVGFLPESFVHLLRALVMHPGYEKISILPIAVTLLKGQGDEVFEVFCNPRLPVAPVQSVLRQEEPELSLENNEENMVLEGTFGENGEVGHKISHATIEGETKSSENLESPSISLPTNFEQVSKEEPEKLMRKRVVDDHDQIAIFETKIRKTVETTKTETPETRYIPVEIIEEKQSTVEVHESEKDDDSDFEIPEIHLSDDDEE
ncbi:LAME_0G17810g1_1 [Lachancea meyersii CBS 8951]|uniref:Pre-rRNA-processing protein RIX1 n=1 Tax=Lachancea meyersii CBS 8951 TaxID=1266667 RepID=A0A1G4KBK0_9SACH|nr:LAME_0G17810g1_1 [Lachancea meyersii CBS 8951]